jgi:hypothetical protein
MKLSEITHDILKLNLNIYKDLKFKGFKSLYVKEKGIIFQEIPFSSIIKVISRRIFTGDISVSSSIGKVFKPLKVSILDKIETSEINYSIMESEASLIFLHFEKKLARKKRKIQLISLVLEYGILEGKPILCSIFTPNSFNCNYYLRNSIDLNKDNVLDQLELHSEVDIFKAFNIKCLKDLK